nr:hypothetical protein [Allomuricauda sp.]
MEKLEKHIKDKLGSREINPSANSWEKISSQLSQPAVGRSNRNYTYAMVAGFIGLLLALGFVFISDGNGIPAQLVDENTTDGHELPTIDHSNNGILESETTMQAAEIEAGYSEPVTDIEFSEKEIILNAEEVASKQEIQDKFNKEADPLIAQKVNEVMAQVTHLESIQQEVSDAEVDSLLRAAQREILTESLVSASGTVDAMALLTEVEDELDASFRDQIFDALKDGYFKLRTAVADRNN